MLINTVYFVFPRSTVFGSRGFRWAGGRPYHLEFLAALSHVVLHYPYIQETT